MTYSCRVYEREKSTARLGGYRWLILVPGNWAERNYSNFISRLDLAEVPCIQHGHTKCEYSSTR